MSQEQCMQPEIDIPLEQKALLQSSQSPPPSRLRTRIMATGYQYKLLQGETEMTVEEDDERSHRKDNRTACLALIIFVLFLTVFGLLILVIVVKGDDGNSGRLAALPKDNVCMTPECIKTSADILNSLDPKEDPCTDMYAYACGGWVRDSALPSGYGKWSKFTELNVKNGQYLLKLIDDKSTRFRGQESSAIAKLKTYYRTCMDKDTIDKTGTKGIEKLIQDYGLWTVTATDNATWDRNGWNFQDAMLAMHIAGSTAFFRFRVTSDTTDTNVTILEFTQSGLTLKSSIEYSNNRSEEFKAAFLSSVSNFGVLLGSDRKDVEAKMEQVYNLEKELSQIFVNIETLDNPFATIKMTLKEFQDMVGPWVDIQHYLNSFFPNHPFLLTEKVQVKSQQYFQKVGDIVKKTDKEVLANYMMWNFLQTKMDYFPESFFKCILPLTIAEDGVANLPDRWQRCLSLTNSALGLAASALYVDKKFKPSSKDQVISALHKVTKEFIHNLDSVSWLDDSTRERLKEKANAISYKVGYPDWILNPRLLDDYYNKLTVKEGEFLQNVMHMSQFYLNKSIDKYGKPPDKSEWHVNPHVVNAFYVVNLNEVVVPAGILQPPFYSPYFPKPFLYATIGMVVGHEMTHGFDNRGRMFDMNGNLGDQWTQATSQEYEKKARCMVEEYERFSLAGHLMNGNQTLNENIADNGGLLMAYRAFKDDHKPETFHLPGLKLSDDQMFFLGFSQLWCSISTENYKILSIVNNRHLMGEIRVKGISYNFPQFAEAFNCPKNSPVVSSKKCRVW